MKRFCVPALVLALSGAALADDDVHAAAEQVAAYYRQGDREAAEQVPRVQAWQQAEGVSVSCTFKSRPEGAVLTVRRQQGTSGAVAVSFPPGTYGAVDPRSKERYGRLYQDIMFLRAPVVVLNEGQDEASVVVPVACGTFRRRGPTPGVPYQLHAVERETSIDRLLVQVCADDAPPSECETALAIWVAREGLGYQYLADRNFHSFAAQRPVGVQHGEGARALLQRSGVNADALPFFREGPERPAQKKEQPKQEDAPQQDDAPADLS